MKKSVPFVAILLLGALLWGTEYIRRDLWAPDEARFALVAKEMRDGHWLVPYRQGEYYAHKPPLMFWLTNLFSLLTGGDIGSVAPRMPSFLGAVMALWAATRLAARWFSAQAAWLTLLILPSSFLFWNKGGFGQIDMLLCGLEIMALYFLFTSNGVRTPARLAAAYTFMGLGILAKGPVGFIVPLGAYITATLASRETFPKPASHWAWGPLLTLAFPGAWLLAAWIQGAPDGFFNELLFKQNVGRLSGEFGGHNKPIYYYLTYFPADFLPWTLALPLSWVALKASPAHDAGRRKLMAWILFVVIFFSLSSSKRNLYILLCYPAAAMLVAAAVENWSRVTTGWLHRTFWSLWGLLAVLGGVMLLAGIIPHAPSRIWTFLPPELAADVSKSLSELAPGSWAFLPAGLVLALGLFFTRQAWKKTGPAHPRWIVAMAASILTTFSLIGGWVYDAFDDLKTPDEIIQVAREVLGPEERIIMWDMNGEIYSLYADRKGFMAHEEEDFLRFIETTTQTNHLLIAHASEWPAIQALIGNQFPVHRFQAGSKKLIWMTFGKEAGSPVLHPLVTRYDQPGSSLNESE